MFNINTFSGEINKTGVAYQSHFLVVFTTPLSSTLGKSSRNHMQNAFERALGQQQIKTSWTTNGYRNLAFRCDRVNIPGRIIISSPYKEGNYGLSREYPSNAVYQPVDTSFIMSKDFSEKIFFETWQDLIIGNHRTSPFGDTNAELDKSKDLNYIKNYTTTISIIQFDNIPDETSAKKSNENKKSGFFDFVSKFTSFGGGGFAPADPVPVYQLDLIEAYPRTIQDIQGDWASSDIHRLNVVFDYKYFQDRRLFPVVTDAEIKRNNFTESGLAAGASVLAGDIARRAGLSQKQQIFLTGATTVARQVFGGLSDKFSIRD